MAAAAGMDCESGRLHPPKHRRTKNQAGAVTPQDARARSAHRKAAIQHPHKVKFRFLPAERGSRFVVQARNLTVGYETATVKGFQLEVERGSRWAILGGNGAGKTTLLKTLVGAISPLSGEIDWSENAGLGYYDQQLSDLAEGLHGDRRDSMLSTAPRQTENCVPISPSFSSAEKTFSTRSRI